MKVNTKLDKGKMVEWEDGVKFLLRPYPLSQIHMSDKVELQIDQLLKMFKYCIIDWYELEDESGKPLACTDKTKQYIFDHFSEIRDFVSEAITKSMTAEDRELKN